MNRENKSIIKGDDPTHAESPDSIRRNQKECFDQSARESNEREHNTAARSLKQLGVIVPHEFQNINEVLQSLQNVGTSVTLNLEGGGMVTVTKTQNSEGYFHYDFVTDWSTVKEASKEEADQEGRLAA